jgi:hypothetical protein
MTKKQLNENDVFTEKLIDWVVSNYPDCVKFNIDESMYKSIRFYLLYNQSSTYGTMVMVCGILFALASLEYFIEIEDYERCAKLIGAIHELNAIVDLKLPTTLHSRWVSENIHLTPMEILDKINPKKH